MKILFLLFSLLLLQPAFATETAKQGDFSGAKTVELPDWFKTTFLDFGDDLQEANDKNRHLMIYFHQNGCPYCSKLVEDNFHNEALVSKLKQHFDAIQINIWGNRELTDWQGDEFSEKQFAQKMKIQFTPTLVFLSPKGESLLRINGYQSVEKMHKILDFISNKNYLKQSFADFISNENQPKKAKNALHKNPIFDSPPHLLFRSKRPAMRRRRRKPSPSPDR
ncbi:MAG: thioredoxin fold domain-containing protein, partial [Candidatus Thioglobus sp.]|nr:thioredoxin fold domain-containing protein [Candidatus Thioglobus sp.]